MNQSQLHDNPNGLETETKRPLFISIVCIIGLLISLLELAGCFYATQVLGEGHENILTIYLKITPVVNIICWAGFWTMRKSTFILFSSNILLTMLVNYNIGVSPFDYYAGLYIVIGIAFSTQLNKMKFI